MALFTKKVVSYNEIPKNVLEGHWIQHYPFEDYVEVHIDPTNNDDPVSNWLETTYPELIDEDSFFIYMDEPSNKVNEL